MKKLQTTYLGLNLQSPVIVASSPFTAEISKIERLEEAGAGAVVLKSIFEEQIAGEAAMLERYGSSPEAADYLNAYLADDYLKGHLQLIEQAKKSIRIPVIASINCYEKGEWIDYARRIEAAGADALELNIFLFPEDIKLNSETIEKSYLAIIASVMETVNIPVSVKLSMRFTNILNIAAETYFRGGKGVVFYNRFFEPDINIDDMSFTTSGILSEASELRNSLRVVGLGSSQLPELDFSISTGVHTGEDAIKAILAGAKTVQICSALYLSGIGVIGKMNSTIAGWMDRHSFESIAEFHGKMNYRSTENDSSSRVQYMRFFPKDVAGNL